LYGTTSRGGSAGYGTVFELKHSAGGWKEEVLYSFLDGVDGASPSAGVIFDSSGNLYGTTTFGGGTYGDGTVFELSPNSRGGWTERIVYSFNYYTDGGNTAADLAFDTKGNLYGTTPQGASSGKSCNENGCGAVFELTHLSDGTWAETTIHIFTGGPDGGVPTAGVVLDSEGSVYGTTQRGGAGPCLHYAEFITPGCGTAFKFTGGTGGTWTETVLYNFVRGGGFATYPSGELFLDNAKHLFGVGGGGNGLGTVFELRDEKNKGWQQNEAHIFYGNSDGISPVGRLVMDAHRDLFGVTQSGGKGNGDGMGIVFELEPSKGGWKERIMHEFTGSPDGENPSAGMASDSRGRLYGTTSRGGSGTGCNGGCGTVYEVTP